MSWGNCSVGKTLTVKAWGSELGPRANVKPGTPAHVYTPSTPIVRCELETGESQPHELCIRISG